MTKPSFPYREDPEAPTPLGRVIRSLLHPASNQTLKDQAVRQMASGAAATMADILVFKICLLSGVHVLLGALLASSMGAAANFAISRTYVFGQVERQKHGPLAQLLLYVPAALASTGLTQLTLLVLSVRLGLPPMPVKILVAVPLVFLWTLLCGKYLIFGKRPGSTEG